jgi:hypothetical protein
LQMSQAIHIRVRVPVVIIAAPWDLKAEPTRASYSEYIIGRFLRKPGEAEWGRVRIVVGVSDS